MGQMNCWFVSVVYFRSDFCMNRMHGFHALMQWNRGFLGCPPVHLEKNWDLNIIFPFGGMDADSG
jgi:hypothetical protein